MEYERPTYCDECALVHADSRRGPSTGWLCTKHKRLPGYSRFVTGQAWDKDQPFLRCIDVNGGICALFQPTEKDPTE